MRNRSLFLFIIFCLFAATSAQALGPESADSKSIVPLRVDLNTGSSTDAVFFHVIQLDTQIFLAPRHALQHLNTQTTPAFLSQIGLLPAQASQMRVYYFSHGHGSLYGRRPLLDAVVIANANFYNRTRVLEVLRRVAYPISYAQPQMVRIEVPHLGVNKQLSTSHGLAREPEGATILDLRLRINQLNIGAGSSGAPIILSGTQAEAGSLLGLVRCRMQSGSFLGVSINSLLESHTIERDFGNFIQTNQAPLPDSRNCIPVDSKKGGGG